jgi:hypothetical protein
MSAPSTSGDEAVPVALLALALGILMGATVLARRNLRDGRGDRHAARALAVYMIAVLLGLWLCQVHLVATPVLEALFLVAVATAVAYGALLWTLYMAFEPFVRRHWPQVLVSMTNLLAGRAHDPIVGRDVLFGTALGVAWTLILRGVDAWRGQEGLVSFPGSLELLLGLRSTLGVVLEDAPYAIRNTLLYFFVLFVLRVLLRRQWMAAGAYAVLFGALSALGEADPAAAAFIGFLYFGTEALAVVRWGLLSLVVGTFVLSILMDVPVTLDTSAWYFGNMILLVALVVALTAWAAYTATAGRLVRVGSFG